MNVWARIKALFNWIINGELVLPGLSLKLTDKQDLVVSVKRDLVLNHRVMFLQTPEKRVEYLQSLLDQSWQKYTEELSKELELEQVRVKLSSKSQGGKSCQS